jgi:hypothetical protein
MAMRVRKNTLGIQNIADRGGFEIRSKVFLDIRLIPAHSDLIVGPGPWKQGKNRLVSVNHI